MGLADFLFGKRKIITYGSLKSMCQVHDVSGLVEAMDNADDNHMPYLLDFLLVLSEKGRYDQILNEGVMEKLMKVFDTGIWMEKKRAALLIASFISHRRIERLADHEVEKWLLELIPGTDIDLAKSITYSLASLASAGRVGEIVYHNGIERLVSSLEIEDPDIHAYILHTLQIITGEGYHELVLRTDLLNRLREDLNFPQSDIKNQARILLNDLYNWKNTGIRFGDVLEQEEIVEETESAIGSRFESLGIEDGYHRPGSPKNGKKKGGKKILGSDGRTIEKAIDKETIEILETGELDPHMKKWEEERKKAIVKGIGACGTHYDNSSDDEEDDFVIEA